MGAFKTALWLIFWPIILHFSMLRFVFNTFARWFSTFVDLLQSVIDWLIDARDSMEDLADSWIGKYQSSRVDANEVDQLVAKHNRKTHKFARFLGKRAYLQFGHRKKTDADMLVTRKWLRNLVQDQYSSLRIQHQIDAIDEALFLSYIPTESYQMCEEYAETKVYKEMLPQGGVSL
jgi:hypothetical protein